MKNLGLRHLMCSALFLSGCTATPDEQLQTRLAMLDHAAKQQVAKEQEQRESELETVPTWYLAPPTPDSGGFYGVGHATSKQLGHALKSARLQAEFELAKLYGQELSGSERSYERGNSDGEVTSQTRFLIDKIVDAIPVVGYQVIEQKMVPLNGSFETFVLLKLPYDELNKALKTAREKALDQTVQASFDDLERRLAKRRAERAQEAEQQFNREQTALKNRADLLPKQNVEPQQEQPPSTTPVVQELFNHVLRND